MELIFIHHGLEQIEKLWILWVKYYYYIYMYNENCFNAGSKDVALKLNSTCSNKSKILMPLQFPIIFRRKGMLFKNKLCKENFS